MREQRTYLIEFRKAGRGNRRSKIQKASINAMSGADATEQAKRHKALQGMKILAVYVDPKYWSNLHKQRAKTRKVKVSHKTKKMTEA